MRRLPNADVLAELYLFKAVPRRALVELCSLAPPVVYAPGTALFRQGDPADVAVLLVEGRLVASVKVGEVVRQVGDVRPGELVGETALFQENGRRSATVVAPEESSALKLSRYALERAPNNEAVIALERHLLGSLARRVRKTNQAIFSEWRATTPLPAPAEPRPDPAVGSRGLWDRLMTLLAGEGE